MNTLIEKDLAQIVLDASKFANAVEDKDFRKVAFDRILEHLLLNESPLHTSPTKKKKLVKSIGKSNGRGSNISKPGPKMWIEELIEEGFFNKPLASGSIRTLLNERGHILKATDITNPLASLVNEKKLRRTKLLVEETGKDQVHWVNW